MISTNLGGIFITILTTVLKIAALIILIKIIAWDSSRIFKAFLQFVERKFLVIQSIKLITLFMLAYKFNILSPFNWILLLFLLPLIIAFLSMFTLRQTELSIQQFKNYRAFKYNKLSEYGLHFFALLMNVRELATNRNKIKEKYKDMMYISLFPVQKFFAVSVTGIEFTNRKDKFITDMQLEEIQTELQPGDVLLKRNDWQATNIGISGFWTHSGLYLGNIEKMDSFFSDAKLLNGRKFSEVLKEEYPEIFNKLLDNSEPNVIEAIEEGVSVKPLSNIAKVDYFSGLRPIASKDQKLNAIKKALSLIGKPYGYHFDIESDKEFICTALIKKSYEGIINLPITKKLGKKIILPNSIAKKYAKERFHKFRQFDFVLFFDLDINSKKAFKSTEIEFCSSYKRNISFYRKRDILKHLSTIIEFKL